jgi:hypothetical protein
MFLVKNKSTCKSKLFFLSDNCYEILFVIQKQLCFKSTAMPNKNKN